MTDSGMTPVKRALLEIRELRAALAAAEGAKRDPVAIVGMGCRFPGGGHGPGALWEMLREGRDAISEIPPDRWDGDTLFDPDASVRGRITTRYGGFVEGVDHFDPGFFGISPLEAMAMDPQQRLLLEVAWEALEHAGQAPDRLAGSATGVFVGIGGVDYVKETLNRPLDAFDPFVAQGVSHAGGSGRLAYVLGLHGPAVSLDTACSSSLLAVHLAVSSLRLGECRMALAGGVSVILSPDMHVALSRAGMLAPDGRCKTFDAKADGFVRSEGCGVVVLKRLQDARDDGDEIWAVIRGSATNQDGRSSGMTAPSGPAQEAVIRAALGNAGVDPEAVRYVEAHGTGTELGDPIEIQALGAVFGAGRPVESPLLVGSIKTNLGHMEAAAGVAGLMKAALSLYHREIPPHLHFQSPNPHIPWEELPIEVAAKPVTLPNAPVPILAGVSAFGFTGSNVHVILESPPSAQDPGVSGEGEEEAPGVMARPRHILKLTAAHPGALRDLAAAHEGMLAKDGADFEGIAVASTVARADLAHRLLVVAETAEEARSGLASWREGRVPDVPGVFAGHPEDPEPPEVAFLFTGHGAQYPGMGRDLDAAHPVFRAAIDECDACAQAVLDRSLRSVLYPQLFPGSDPERGGGGADLLDRMTYAQPALFAVEYALSQLWRSWGVEPSIVLGHSVGEYAAACVAGILRMEDGLRLVAARGRLMDALPEIGAMLALFAGEVEVRSLLARVGDGQAISVAAVNGPTEVVISGTQSATDRVSQEAEREGIEVRHLAVGAAAHSPLLDPILDEFEEVAGSVEFSAPRLDFVSSTLARTVTHRDVSDPAYWRRHLREPVRFADALRHAWEAGARAFVEVGPNPRLCGMGSRCLPDEPALWLPSLRAGEDEWQQILESVAALHAAGGVVDWERLEGAHGARRIRRRGLAVLPTYPWRHRRYRIADEAGARASSVERAGFDAWASLERAGRRQEVQAPLDLSVAEIPRVWKVLDRLTTAIAADTLRRMGAFAPGDEAPTPETLLAGLGLLPRYHALVGRWLDRLQEEGWIERAGDRLRASDRFHAPELEARKKEAQTLPPDARFLVAYLVRCHQALPDVLVGRTDPLETLFPGGSTETADLLYRDWALVRYFNHLIGALVSEFVRQRGDGTGIRALEVGAGTGGTTAAVLPSLAGRAERYDFTDVSELFLDRARAAFEGYPFLRYGILDLNRDPGDQGFSEAGYDLVVAANVLHATGDLPRALESVRSLLAPGGVLVAFEATRYLSWFEVSTALLEGWEGREDDIRGGIPLLDVERWTGLLEGAGFERILAFPEDSTPTSALGLHVIVAGVEGSPGAPGRRMSSAVGGIAASGDPTAGVAGGEAASRGRPPILEELEAAQPARREKLLLEYVRGHVRSLLRMDPSDTISGRRRLMELGLDSLMAVEFRGRLGRGLGLADALPATLVFDYPTIDQVVGLLGRTLFPGEEEPERPGRADASAFGDDPAEDGLDDLTEEEAEARLLERLDAIEGVDS